MPRQLRCESGHRNRTAMSIDATLTGHQAQPTADAASRADVDVAGDGLVPGQRRVRPGARKRAKAKRPRSTTAPAARLRAGSSTPAPAGPPPAGAGDADLVERPDDGRVDAPPDAAQSSHRQALKARQMAEAAPMWRQLLSSFVMPIAAGVVRKRVGVDLDACVVMASQHVAKGDHVEVREFRASASDATAIALSELLAYYVPVVQGEDPRIVPGLTLLGVAGVIVACKTTGAPAVDLTRAPSEQHAPPATAALEAPPLEAPAVAPPAPSATPLADADVPHAWGSSSVRSTPRE